jgi:hypothetical protein
MAVERGRFDGPAVIVVVVVAGVACSKTLELGAGMIVQVVIARG